VPLKSGKNYRVVSPPTNALVSEDLANELHRVLERFAAEAGGTSERPIRIFFKPGIFGHHQVGRAADIYAVNGIGLDQWKQRWDSAMQRARIVAAPLEHQLIREREGKLRLAIVQSVANVWTMGATLRISYSALRSVDTN
jgi:hypothetical protein